MSVSKKDIKAAWERAATINGKDPDVWRRDETGEMIRFGSYGTVNGEYSWEIDHRKPVSKGGSDHGRNLRVLNTQANRKKSDKY